MKSRGNVSVRKISRFSCLRLLPTEPEGPTSPLPPCSSVVLAWKPITTLKAVSVLLLYQQKSFFRNEKSLKRLHKRFWELVWGNQWGFYRVYIARWFLPALHNGPLLRTLLILFLICEDDLWWFPLLHFVDVNLLVLAANFNSEYFFLIVDCLNKKWSYSLISFLASTDLHLMFHFLCTLSYIGTCSLD